jgi:hypothetical protein
MDIGKSFAFVFEDDQWITKILIAAAILLVGILFSWVLAIPLILAVALLSGYMVEIIRRVIAGQVDGLPDWDDWGALLTDGIKFMVVGIVYAIPLIIIAFCLGVPMGIFSEDAEALSSFLGLVLSCLTFIYAIAMSIVLPAAVAFWVADDDLGAAFRFGDVFRFTGDNLSTYLITFVMSWVAQIIGNLGAVVCGVGWLVTVPYAYMVMGHLYGQAYTEGTASMAAPLAVEEVESA